MFDLTGKTALVTGASGGIGGAIAKALSEKGAQIVLSGTRREKLEETASTLSTQSHILTCNLSDPEERSALVATAENEFAPIDILVSNAGLTRDQLLLRMKDEDWRNVLEVNLTAYFDLTRTALKGMMRRKWGRIIAISSVVGVMGNAGQANYAASKAGMIGYTKSLAQEIASRGITANCIAPGFIATAMTDVLPDAQKDKLLEGIPAKKLGSSEDIAAGAVYLASEEAAYITGQTLHINGGMVMI